MQSSSSGQGTGSPKAAMKAFLLALTFPYSSQMAMIKVVVIILISILTVVGVSSTL
jgi:hypothetical protein